MALGLARSRRPSVMMRRLVLSLHFPLPWVLVVVVMLMVIVHPRRGTVSLQAVASVNLIFMGLYVVI